MDAISVRNKFSQEIISVMTRKRVPVVEDPTMLVDLDQLQQPVENLPEKYILTYIMGSEIEGGHRLVLDAIKKKIGNYPIISIVSTAQCPQFFSFADQRLYHVGPEEWIFLLKNASYIYTDSFHASLYAVKHQSPFFAYYTEHSRRARFIDMIKRYKLSYCIASNAKEAIPKISSSSFKKNVDRTNELISGHIDQSLAFISQSL